ncbi:hypothetical protein L218DRAFT_957714 [Marasmius fiardii PR-910]|nr:hypothetical protein L218DRAFT_957714 [Marasmius fiardii PR-910]
MDDSANDLERILASYLTAERVITNPLSTLSVMFAIYGIYVMAFGLAIHTLSRRDGPSSRLYMGWSISLFVLATLFVAINAWGLSRQTMIQFKAATTKNYTPFQKYLRFDEGEILWFAIINFVDCIMSAVADSMLIHRCCVIWQSRIMMHFLAFLAVVLNGIHLGTGIAGTVGMSISNDRLYNTASTIDNGRTITVAFFQVLLALLTGGRIWWISREARRLMGWSTNARYNSIVAIIIESGLIFAACLVAEVALVLAVDPDAHGFIPFDFGPVTVLMSGLAPTLIIVRVAYGKSVNSVQQMVSLQWADTQGNSQRSRPAIGSQPQTQIQSVHVQSQLDEPLPTAATGEKMV